MSNLQRMTNANRTAVRVLCAARKLDAFIGYPATRPESHQWVSKPGLEPPMT